MNQYRKITLAALAASSAFFAAACGESEGNDATKAESCAGCSGAFLSGCEQAWDACESKNNCDTADVKAEFADKACL